MQTTLEYETINLYEQLKPYIQYCDEQDKKAKYYEEFVEICQTFKIARKDYYAGIVKKIRADVIKMYGLISSSQLDPSTATSNIETIIKIKDELEHSEQTMDTYVEDFKIDSMSKYRRAMVVANNILTNNDNVVVDDQVKKLQDNLRKESRRYSNQVKESLNMFQGANIQSDFFDILDYKVPDNMTSYFYIYLGYLIINRQNELIRKLNRRELNSFRTKFEKLQLMKMTLRLRSGDFEFLKDYVTFGGKKYFILKDMNEQIKNKEEAKNNTEFKSPYNW